MSNQQNEIYEETKKDALEESNLQKIKEAYIVANPEIMIHTGAGYSYPREIQLADVLMASEHFTNLRTVFWQHDTIKFLRDSDGRQCSWDLTKDLDQQSEETISFLASLL